MGSAHDRAFFQGSEDITTSGSLVPSHLPEIRNGLCRVDTVHQLPPKMLMGAAASMESLVPHYSPILPFGGTHRESLKAHRRPTSWDGPHVHTEVGPIPVTTARDPYVRSGGTPPELYVGEPWGSAAYCIHVTQYAITEIIRRLLHEPNGQVYALRSPVLGGQYGNLHRLDDR